MSQILNVLMIEDSEDDALLILRKLRQDQFDLVWERVQTAEALHTMLTTRQWDIIITDYHLPGFSAPAALDIVQQTELDIPFIVVSGAIGEQSAVEMMKAGAHDYVMKDNLARLPEVVRREMRDAHIRADRKRAERMLAKRDRYLMAVLEVQRLLLSATVSQALYTQILELLGAIAEADRIYVFENHTDATGQLLTSQRAEWCAPGIPPQLDNPLLQNLCYSDIPHFYEILASGGIINSPVSSFPELEQLHLEAQAIRSILVIPLIASGEFFGFIGFDDCQTENQWAGLEVDLLSAAAAAIALSKEREQATQALAQLNRELEDRVKHRTVALQESEAKLQAILDYSPEVIYVKDLEGRHILVNQAFLKLHTCTMEDVIGKTDQELFPPNVAEILTANDRHVITTGQFQQYEEVLTIGDKVCTFLSNKFLLPGQDGQPYALCGISTDISDRKHAEAQLYRTNEELLRATRLKDEFLANMSHELRTPLNAILGMTESLQEGVFGKINERQDKALQTIDRSGTHLLELINDILDVAKIESGQIELECFPVAVSSLCQSSLSFIKQQALKKRIQLEINVPSNLPEIMGDERRIRQVLINLLNNAVKFTPEGGHVTLQAIYPIADGTNSSTTNFLRIAVVDTGIGIASEHFNKLFQPFMQIDSALNRQYEGTGLGLALVKRIVELHGGQVGVTSEVGVGSCFTIDLPCVCACPTVLQSNIQENTTQAIVSTPVETAPLILLAEDNEANLLTITSYLTTKGYRVLAAKTGQEAIALAQTAQPDLILMDVQMPGMDGLEAIQQIRQDANLLEVPIIALTALAMNGDRDRCLAVGADEYLSKPVKLKHLASLIESFLVTG